MKEIFRVGDTIKINCPVSGYPMPSVEWFKNRERIDFMWDRHITKKKTLKIKNVSEDDTGIYHCKAINGFGSEEVRIELIVVDPRQFPKSLMDPNGSGRPDVAPPVFTVDTTIALRKHKKSVGETFKVSCEALGSPQPEIFWFKDGQHIHEPVHYQRGRSTVELNVMGPADSGLYTCRAKNMLGEQTMNFTLEVDNVVGAPHAIVTVVGSSDKTVEIGGDATLQCRVKSIYPPTVQWLKRGEDGTVGRSEDTYVLGQSQVKFRMLDTKKSVPTGTDDEYLTTLVLSGLVEEDAGMYICFVTNSGFNANTYKSMNLRVIESKYFIRETCAAALSLIKFTYFNVCRPFFL